MNTQSSSNNLAVAVSSQNPGTSVENSTFMGQGSYPTSQKNMIVNNTQSGMGVAELISQSMNGNSSASLWDTIQASKWLLVKLKDVNNLQQFSRVYLMFTSTRIVLYCPCNTYYSFYQLNGNTLRAEGWNGTNNNCDVNNDQEVTDYIFYANMLKLKGQDIVFYYNSQVQLAEFKPYY